MSAYTNSGYGNIRVYSLTAASPIFFSLCSTITEVWNTWHYTCYYDSQALYQSAM